MIDVFILGEKVSRGHLATNNCLKSIAIGFDKLKKKYPEKQIEFSSPDFVFQLGFVRLWFFADEFADTPEKMFKDHSWVCHCGNWQKGGHYCEKCHSSPEWETAGMHYRD